MPKKRIRNEVDITTNKDNNNNNKTVSPNFGIDYIDLLLPLRFIKSHMFVKFNVLISLFIVSIKVFLGLLLPLLPLILIFSPLLTTTSESLLSTCLYHLMKLINPKNP